MHKLTTHFLVELNDIAERGSLKDSRKGTGAVGGRTVSVTDPQVRLLHSYKTAVRDAHKELMIGKQDTPKVRTVEPKAAASILLNSPAVVASTLRQEADNIVKYLNGTYKLDEDKLVKKVLKFSESFNNSLIQGNYCRDSKRKMAAYVAKALDSYNPQNPQPFNFSIGYQFRSCLTDYEELIKQQPETQPGSPSLSASTSASTSSSPARTSPQLSPQPSPQPSPNTSSKPHTVPGHGEQDLQRAWEILSTAALTGNLEQKMGDDFGAVLNAYAQDQSISPQNRQRTVNEYLQLANILISECPDHSALNILAFTMGGHLAELNREQQLSVDGLQGIIRTLKDGLSNGSDYARLQRDVIAGINRHLQGLSVQAKGVFLADLQNAIAHDVAPYVSKAGAVQLLIDLGGKLEQLTQITESEQRALRTNAPVQQHSSPELKRSSSPAAGVYLRSPQHEYQMQPGYSESAAMPSLVPPESSELDRMDTMVAEEVRSHPKYPQMRTLVSALRTVVDPHLHMTTADWAACLNDKRIYSGNLQDLGRGLKNGKTDRLVQYFRAQESCCRGQAVNQFREEIVGQLEQVYAQDDIVLKRVPEDGNSLFSALSEHYNMTPSSFRGLFTAFINKQLKNPSEHPELTNMLGKNGFPTREQLEQLVADGHLARMVTAGPQGCKHQPDWFFMPVLARYLGMPVVLYTLVEGQATLYSYNKDGLLEEDLDKLPGAIQFVYDPETNHFDALERRPKPAVASSSPADIAASPYLSSQAQQQAPFSIAARGRQQVYERPVSPGEQRRQEQSLRNPASASSGGHVYQDSMASLMPNTRRADPSRGLQRVWEELQDYNLATETNWDFLRGNFSDATLCQPGFVRRCAAFSNLDYGSQILAGRNQLPCEPITMHNFKAFYLSGILSDRVVDEMLAMGRDQQKDISLIRRLHGDLLNVDMQKDDEMEGLGLKNRAGWMARLGNSCWINSTLQMTLQMLSQRDIQDIKDSMHGYPDPSIQRLARAVIDFWETGQQMKSGQTEPACLLGQQREFMDACHEVAKSYGIKHYCGSQLLETFAETARPQTENDPAVLLEGIMDVLNLNRHARLSFEEKQLKTITLNGQPVSVIGGGGDTSSQFRLGIPTRSSGMEVLARSLSPQQLQQLQANPHPVPELDKVRQCFLAYHQVVTAPVELGSDPGEKELREATDALWQAMQEVYRGVPRMDALIVNTHDGKLVTDCRQYNGQIIPQGAALPVPGNKVPDFPYVPVDGLSSSSDGVLHSHEDGSCYIAHKKEITISDPQLQRLVEGRNKQWECIYRGVAVVDDQGYLVDPCLEKTMMRTGDYQPAPKDMLPRGQFMMDSEGRALAPFGTIRAGEQLVDPDLKFSIINGNPDSMKKEERLQLAQGLAGMMGLPNYQNGAQAEALLQPLSVKQCLEDGSKLKQVIREWDREDFIRAGVAPQDWPEELRNDPGVQGVRLPTLSREVMEADRDKLSKFNVMLSLFQYVNAEESHKRGDDATEVFLNGGDPINITMYDKNSGEPFKVEGKLRSLVCHSGNNIKFGHFINLSFELDGTVTVQDDVVNLSLEDYIRLREITGPEGQPIRNVEDFLRLTSFKPYMAHYHRINNKQQRPAGK